MPRFVAHLHVGWVEPARGCVPLMARIFCHSRPVSKDLKRPFKIVLTAKNKAGVGTVEDKCDESKVCRVLVSRRLTRQNMRWESHNLPISTCEY